MYVLNFCASVQKGTWYLCFVFLGNTRQCPAISISVQVLSVKCQVLSSNLNSSIISWMLWHSLECQNPLTQILVYHCIFTNPCCCFYGVQQFNKLSRLLSDLVFAWDRKPSDVYPIFEIFQSCLLFFAPTQPFSFLLCSVTEGEEF